MGLSKELKEHVLNGGFIHCRDIHGHSCEKEAMIKFFVMLKLTMKLYLPVHLIPALIFKRKLLKTQPLEFFKHFLKNFFRSVLMLTIYTTIFRYLLCQTKNVRHKLDKWNPIIGGLVAPWTILMEPAGRRPELVLFMLPRALETFWNALACRNIVKNIRHGEVIVFAIAMSIICYCYQNEQDCIKPTYLGVFKKFYGEN